MSSRDPRLGRVGRSLSGMALVLSVSAVFAAEQPEAALDRLRRGNERFVRAWSGAGALGARRAAVESPLAAILSCADSAVAPEQAFDTAPGELVSVRVAGPVTDRVVVATLEHAVERESVAALVVMGHDACDTLVRASQAKGRPRGADAIADTLASAITRAAGRADLDARLAMVQATVEQTVNDLLRSGERLRQRVKDGELAVVGAYFETGTGRVVFSRPIDRLPALAGQVTSTR